MLSTCRAHEDPIADRVVAANQERDLDTFEQAVAALRDGRPALLINELRDLGVVGLPIATTTVEWMNYLVTACRGIVYVAVPRVRLEQLRIPPQATVRGGPDHIFVPVDASEPVTTGISAADRVETVRRLVAPDATGTEFRQPGHITPMALDEAGVVGRYGLAEAVQEVASGAGHDLGVVFAGVLTEDGHMADAAWLERFGQREGLAALTVADTVRAHRRRRGGTQEASRDLAPDYLSWQARVDVRGGGLQEQVPIAVIPVCVDGHTLGCCTACGEATAAARARFAAAANAALVATWPRSGIPRCDNVLSERELEGLRSLVAADHFGAAPTVTTPA